MNKEKSSMNAGAGAYISRNVGSMGRMSRKPLGSLC